MSGESGGTYGSEEKYFVGHYTTFHHYCAVEGVMGSCNDSTRLKLSAQFFTSLRTFFDVPFPTL